MQRGHHQRRASCNAQHDFKRELQVARIAPVRLRPTHGASIEMSVGILFVAMPAQRALDNARCFTSVTGG